MMANRENLDKIKQKVKDQLLQMTIEEKLAQLGSYYIYELQTKGILDTPKIEARLKHGIGQISRNAGASNYLPLAAAKSANALQRFLKEKTRLGIPAIIHEECCSGVTASGCSIFPQMLGLASTFQPELATQMTSAIRIQMRAIGAHQGLAPVLDVSRDSRWGRVEETFGEDPTLVSQFGVAYIRGLQGDDLTTGVMATGKHFVGHSFSQGGLNCGPVHLGMRDLWDIYLAPFQAAIRDAGIASMMNAYPEIDGEVVAGSRRFLTDLLRDTLGFDGVVVSDYEAVVMIHNYHHAVESKRAAAVKALTAGIDVENPSVNCYGEELKAALELGEISIETIDLSVSRHLQKKFELGLFDDPYVNEGNVLAVIENKDNRDLANKIACQSMVLLKNDGLLPLSRNMGKIAVIGPNANSSRNMMGDYSYAAMAELMMNVSPEYTGHWQKPADTNESQIIKIPTILESIKQLVSASTSITYAKGCDTNSNDTTGFDQAVKAARASDVAILVMGDRSGLAWECSTGEFRDAADLHLPGVQESLVKTILETGKPVVLVLVNGRPTAITDLVEKTNAILEAWVPGEEGGKAVAGVLFGEVNPGGKLPISIPRSVGQVPIFYNYKPSGMRSNIYGDYVAEKVTPLFPFGHGLSYTNFSYSGLTISSQKAKADQTIDISMKVRNTGNKPGDEVVQLYLRDEYACLPRPVKELKGFTRVTLQPGETRKVTFHLPVNQMAFYDEDLKLILEPGKMLVMVGSSSEDIRLNGEFEITGTGKAAVKDRVFVCPVDVG
jgi:beta-glucosidase